MIERVTLSRHAAERYLERVRPTLLSVHDAHIEATRLLAQHGELGADPAWLHAHPDAEVPREPDAWVWLGDGIAFPCRRLAGRRLFALTCLARGAVSEPTRQRRNRARRRRPSGEHDGRFRADPRAYRRPRSYQFTEASA